MFKIGALPLILSTHTKTTISYDRYLSHHLFSPNPSIINLPLFFLWIKKFTRKKKSYLIALSPCYRWDGCVCVTHCFFTPKFIKMKLDWLILKCVQTPLILSSMVSMHSFLFIYLLFIFYFHTPRWSKIYFMYIKYICLHTLHNIKVLNFAFHCYYYYYLKLIGLIVIIYILMYKSFESERLRVCKYGRQQYI